jgi:hypothetical protein
MFAIIMLLTLKTFPDDPGFARISVVKLVVKPA